MAMVAINKVIFVVCMVIGPNLVGDGPNHRHTNAGIHKGDGRFNQIGAMIFSKIALIIGNIIFIEAIGLVIILAGDGIASDFNPFAPIIIRIGYSARVRGMIPTFKLLLEIAVFNNFFASGSILTE